MHITVYLGASCGTDPHLCLLYTSDAADDLLCVDLGGRRIIKKKTKNELVEWLLRHNNHANK